VQRSLAVLFLTLSAAVAHAAVELPRVSPAHTIKHALGISTITVSYHRPAVRGRKVWGDLVPYGQVWRLGANNATTVEISDPMCIGGKELPAGRYALFAIPGAQEWTLVFSRKPEQWGSYFYKESDDALRVNVKSSAAPFTEWMRLSLEPRSANRVDLTMEWERVAWSVPIEADVNAIVWKRIDAALASVNAGDWETFHNAARFSLDTGERREEALQWIDSAMKTENFWNYELKARLLHREGRTAQALPLMEQAIALAAGKAPAAYVDGLRSTVAEWKAAK
jgi:Protein of unknown function (DUF2911)